MSGNLDAWRACIDELHDTEPSELDRTAWLTKMAQFWDPDVEFDMSEAPGVGLSGIHVGCDEVRELWREWLTAFDTFRFDYQFVDAGKWVVMLVEWRPRVDFSGSDLPVWQNAWVSTFRDGLMVRSKFFMSHAEALEAAGLSE